MTPNRKALQLHTSLSKFLEPLWTWFKICICTIFIKWHLNIGNSTWPDVEESNQNQAGIQLYETQSVHID